MNYIVRIDHLEDDQLALYGFARIDAGEEFSLYLHVRYNEMQPVSNVSPRYIIVDDWNDAQYMSADDATVVTGPTRRLPS
jgi:hypothetical protein